MSSRLPVDVVVVDASPDFRWILRRVFQRKGGFDVVGDTEDLEVGIDLVRSSQPRVVLVDLDDPRVDVAGVVRRIRVGCPHASVLATTTIGRPEVRDTVLAAGGDGLVRKGVSLQHTFDQLWSVLAEKPNVRSVGQLGTASETY